MLVVAAAVAAEEPPPIEYPTAVIERPLVLPHALARVELLPGLEVDPGSRVGWAVVRGAVGVGDRVELGLATGAGIAPVPRWGRSVFVGARVRVADGDVIDFAPAIGIRWRVAWIGFELELDPGLRVVFGRGYALLGGVRDPALDLFAPPSIDAALSLPVAVGWQVADVLAVELQSRLGRLHATEGLASAPWQQPLLGLGAVLTPTPDLDLLVAGSLGTVLPEAQLHGSVRLGAALRF